MRTGRAEPAFGSHVLWAQICSAGTSKLWAVFRQICCRQDDGVHPRPSFLGPALGAAQCRSAGGLCRVSCLQLCGTSGPACFAVSGLCLRPVIKAVTAWRSQKRIASSSDAHTHPVRCFCLLIIPLRITAPSRSGANGAELARSVLSPHRRVLQLLPHGRGSPCSVTLGSDRNCMLHERVCRPPRQAGAGHLGVCGLSPWAGVAGRRALPVSSLRLGGGRQRPRQPGASQRGPAKISRCMRNEHLSVMTA